ncbi:MAG: threonine/serine exporter family protein [Bacteriovoracaceae bacterium]|jgi:uncharacterized membrane protein YjjP (DUF1212 family)|nr:hypothetical protein [Halobacteriovoraceae bacterium]MDP7319923.1 threonine/serine exporter family protein [Bacteriovoracaceae bacterium]
MATTDFNKKVKLIRLIGITLHKYGTNAPRLEASLKDIASKLGLTGNFYISPTYLSISIDSEDDQISRHVRVLPGETNLAKLHEVDHIASLLCEQKLSIDEAIEKIQAVETGPNNYPNIVTVLAYTMTSTALAIILQGGLIEVILSTLIGAMVGILGILKFYFIKINEIFEFAAAFMAMSFCYLFFTADILFNYQIVLISALIVLVPGLSLTIAMNELATQNLVSGTARLMGAMIDFFKIAFGILLAVEIGKIFFGKIPLVDVEALSSLYLIPAIFLATLSLTVIFNARKKDFVYILMSGVITIGALQLSSLFFNQILSVFLSAFTMSFFSNLFARVENRPAAIIFLPGLILLVPGSVGLRGLNLIFQNEFIQGLTGGFQMFIIAITIVAGIFLANISLNPRKHL